MANQIATGSWINTNKATFSPNTYQCPTRSIIEGNTGFSVSPSYASNQCVVQEDISAPAPPITYNLVVNTNNATGTGAIDGYIGVIPSVYIAFDGLPQGLAQYSKNNIYVSPITDVYIQLSNAQRSYTFSGNIYINGIKRTIPATFVGVGPWYTASIGSPLTPTDGSTVTMDIDVYIS